MVIARAETIPHDKGRNAQRREPTSRLNAFLVGRQVRVAAARKNHDRRARRMIGRQEGRDRRPILRRIAERARSTAGPERHLGELARALTLDRRTRAS